MEKEIIVKMIQEEIKNEIKRALNKLGLKTEINLEHPEDLSHGDYSTNVAMVLAKGVGKNPRELAEEISSEIKSDLFSRVEVAGPGFINFYLKDSFFIEALGQINEDFGKTDIHKRKSILVEHSSPNLLKPFHIGHVMNNTIGESIVRLAEFSGAKVTRLSYPSDVSLGLGKTIWALIEKKIDLDDLSTEDEKLKALGDAYVFGTSEYEDNPKKAEEIKAVTRKIYEKTPSHEYDVYLKGKELSLSYFKKETKRLGSEFDDFIFESEAGVVGKKIVLENVPNIFKESDGAVIYKGEEEGLHTRVFINAEGYPTYEAKDIGLLKLKFDKKPDLSILITDSQQNEYYKVVLSAAEKINKDWKEKTIHRTHGRMTFKGKKMSSRLGGVPLASTVLDTVLEEVKEKSPEADSEKLNQISVAALKFSILRAMAGKNIDFDPDTSLSFEGDSGPYLQYTIARCNSVLEKAEDEGFKIKEKPVHSYTPSEVEKIIYRFPEVVEKSISEWAPHHVSGYILELSRSFNSWYGKTKIIDKENENAGYNLNIVSKVATTIKNGLYLLGIESPDRM